MIKVIRMTSVDDDVAIEVLAELPDECGWTRLGLVGIYETVKRFAMSTADNIQKPLVEMSENEQGLPHASIYYQNNVIEQQIFATRK